MTNVKEFTPLDGETVLTVITGNAWSSNPNPIAQLLGFLYSIIYLIFGVKLRTYIVATNLRIVQVDKKTVLWGLITTRISIMTLNKATINAVGYSMKSAWLFFRKYAFELNSGSVKLEITFKGKKAELIESCRVVDNVIAGK